MAKIIKIDVFFYSSYGKVEQVVRYINPEHVVEIRNEELHGKECIKIYLSDQRTILSYKTIEEVIELLKSC